MYPSSKLPLPETFGHLYSTPTAVKNQKQQHLDAHALFAQLCHASGITDTTLRYGKMGKPSLAAYPDCFFNLSHCDGLAVCLFSEKECGVDAETIRPVRMRVAERVFTESELAALETAQNPDLFFTRLWTLKEAFVKTVGTGISYPMKQIEFSIMKDTVLSSHPEYGFAQLLLSSHVISVCIASPVQQQPVLICTD